MSKKKRINRSNNIIIHNLSEFNKSTPKDEEQEFFQQLTSYNKDVITEFLSILDDGLKAPIYSKRIEKFRLNVCRPFAIMLSSSEEVKLVFKNLSKLKTTKYEKCSIQKYLTPLQRTNLKDLKS